MTERAPCLCSHLWVWHLNRDPRCEIAGCGCGSYRPDERYGVPARFRDEYDPSPDGIDRRPA